VDEIESMVRARVREQEAQAAAKKAEDDARGVFARGE